MNYRMFHRHIQCTARIVFAALITFLVIPAETADAMERVEDLLKQSAFTNGEQRLLQRVFDSARASEVPIDFLVPRLQEGISKGIDARRIVGALETDLSNLKRAREIAQTIPGGTTLVSDHARWARAATLLAADRPPDELRTLITVTSTRPDRFRSAGALHVSLINWGLSPQQSLEIVQAAVSSQLAPEDYPGIAELFATARRERIRPDRMVERIVRGLERADTIGTLRRIVVE